MLEYHGRLSIGCALRMIDRLERFHPTWSEEPVVPVAPHPLAAALHFDASTPNFMIQENFGDASLRRPRVSQLVGQGMDRELHPRQIMIAARSLQSSEFAAAR